MYKKFIITEEGVLKFGVVDLHRDLIEIGQDTCYGGGLWTIDHSRNAVILYGRSFDFGGPDFTRMKQIDWAGVGGREIPLLYAPYWPDTSVVDAIGLF